MGRGSKGSAVIRVSAILNLSSSSFWPAGGPEKTRDLPRLPARVHSWAGRNSSAALCRLLRIKSECHQCRDYVMPGSPRQTWPPTSPARMHTARRSRHLVRFIIRTPFERPRITQKMGNRSHLHGESSVEGDVVTESTQGSEPPCSLHNISGTQARTIFRLTLGSTHKQVGFPLKQTQNGLFTAMMALSRIGGCFSTILLTSPPFWARTPLAVKIRRWPWVAFYFSSTFSWRCNSAFDLQTKEEFVLSVRERKLWHLETWSGGSETSLFQDS